jgi:hypothetical protein
MKLLVKLGSTPRMRPITSIPLASLRAARAGRLKGLAQVNEDVALFRTTPGGCPVRSARYDVAPEKRAGFAEALERSRDKTIGELAAIDRELRRRAALPSVPAFRTGDQWAADLAAKASKFIP